MASDNKEIDRTDLILSANRALLGEIRPNMRRIYAEYKKKENEIILHFFYDTQTTEEDMDYDVEGTILTDMSCGFSDDVKCNVKSYVIPHPQKIECQNAVCVYSKYEKYPEEERNGIQS